MLNNSNILRHMLCMTFSYNNGYESLVLDMLSSGIKHQCNNEG